MKRFLCFLTTILLLTTLVACGGGSATENSSNNGTGAPTESKSDLDIIGGNYKLVYDVTDSNAVSLMTDIIGKVNTASGVKLSSSNSGNPETEFEIQLGLKSGRTEAESVYNEIKGYGNDLYSAYTIRAVGKKLVISASDKDALKVAADKFAAMASDTFVIPSDFNETAIFNTEEYRYGKLNLIHADEFMSNVDVLAITVNEKTIECLDGKKDYAAATIKGNTAFDVKPITKYPSTKTEITQKENLFEIKVKSADGKKEEIYTMKVVQTAPLDSYDINVWTAPYWEGNLIYHESVMFVGDDGAPLLYTPEHVLSVRSYDLKTEYVEGVDYEIKDGKLYRLEGSEMPHFTWDEFYPTSKETSVSGNAFAGSKKPFVFFSEGSYFHKNQVFVTYTHAADDSIFVPAKSTKLTKFTEKLQKGEAVNVVFFGDSITAGANASGRNGALPGTPIWSDIVATSIQNKYPSAKVNHVNTGVGGKETNWAIEELETRVNAHNPDLLVLAFGMNDGSKTTEKFIANLKTIIDRVLAANPDCEIAVIGTMLPHSETTYYKNQNLQEAALYELSRSYGNVDVIPMTSVHSSILEHKRYFDMTGNNVNHPNDFLIRIYAQTILRTIGVQ